MKTKKLNHLCYQLQEGNIAKDSEWVSIDAIPPEIVAERKVDGKRVTLLEVIADYERQLMNYRARDAKIRELADSCETRSGRGRLYRLASLAYGGRGKRKTTSGVFAIRYIGKELKLLLEGGKK